MNCVCSLCSLGPLRIAPPRQNVRRVRVDVEKLVAGDLEFVQLAGLHIENELARLGLRKERELCRRAFFFKQNDADGVGHASTLTLPMTSRSSSTCLASSTCPNAIM